MEQRNTPRKPLLLVIGATGSIGRLVVNEAIKQGFPTRVLVRNMTRANLLPSKVETFVGDLTQPDSLVEALHGVEAVIFTHGMDDNESSIEQVSYGGVRNILSLIKGNPTRIILMSAVGVTARQGLYNTSHLAEWKRRAERLVRVSGHTYTIVRPGWFDGNQADEQCIQFRQGDQYHSGTPNDGAVSRHQIAQVLISSITSPAANKKTFELVAEKGSVISELEPLFAALPQDIEQSLDGIGDVDNMPLAQEPQKIKDDLQRLKASAFA